MIHFIYQTLLQNKQLCCRIYLYEFMKWFSRCISIMIINFSALKLLIRIGYINIQNRMITSSATIILQSYNNSEFYSSCQENENNILLGKTMLWIILFTRKYETILISDLSKDSIRIIVFRNPENYEV